MDIQLKLALANGGKLEFNGDETELAAGDLGYLGLMAICRMTCR